MIFIIQRQPFKRVQKNMVKAWNFTENKICHRCFENNLQKLGAFLGFQKILNCAFFMAEKMKSFFEDFLKQ